MAGTVATTDPTSPYAAVLDHPRKDRVTLGILWAHAVFLGALALLGSVDALPEIRSLPPAGRTAVVGLGLVAALVPTLHRPHAGSHCAWRFSAVGGLLAFSYLLLFLSGGYGAHAHLVLVVAFSAIYADWRLPVAAGAAAVLLHVLFFAVRPDWLATPPWGLAGLVGRGTMLALAAAVSAQMAREHLRSVVAASDARDEMEQAIERQRAAEESVRTNADRLLTVFDAMPQGVVILDGIGQCVFVNMAAARMLRATKHEITRRPWHDAAWGVVGPGGPDGLPFREVLGKSDGEGLREVECRVLRGGEPRSLLATLVPFRDGNDRPAGVVVTLLDITSRKEDEEELESARRQLALGEKTSALGSLVSGVFHELRTPLTYIQNNLYVVRAKADRLGRQQPDAAGVAKEIAEAIESALEGAARINHLVTGLRRFARTQPAEDQHVLVHEVVREAVDLFRRTHPGETEVVADLHPTLPVSADPVQVQQVVLNLLDNAADAMGRRGTVHVGTRPTPGGAEITVGDQGPGIPRELQPRVFDEFFTTKPEGTGLGLAIVRRIVEDHGGSLALASAPGHGTRFTIALPRDGLAARRRLAVKA